MLYFRHLNNNVYDLTGTSSILTAHTMNLAWQQRLVGGLPTGYNPNSLGYAAPNPTSYGCTTAGVCPGYYGSWSQGPLFVTSFAYFISESPGLLLPNTMTRLDNPGAMTVDTSGNLYFTETAVNVVKKVFPPFFPLVLFCNEQIRSILTKNTCNP